MRRSVVGSCEPWAGAERHMVPQCLAHSRQRGYEEALVGLGPVGVRGYHVTASFGAMYWLKVGLAGLVSTVSALSAPSTRTRRR